VLDKLCEHKLAVKRSKCSFGASSVGYLGHVISTHDVAMDVNKVEAVRAWQQPRSVRAVRGFIGLTGYYRTFIRSYGELAGHLTQLLKCDAFCWSLAVAAAFKALKAALTSAPVLQLPDFTRVFIVDCDTSGSRFSAILHQGDSPIAFFSHVVSLHHAKLIGLMKAVKQ
jgi:hypothetical protein